MAITEIAGLAGAGLARAAYVPQISHLIRARCSAGISRLARVWFLAFGRWRGTSAGHGALRERWRSYLRPCAGFELARLRGTT